MNKGKNYKKITGNNKVVKRLILLIVTFVVAIIAIIFLCKFIIRTINMRNALKDGPVISNNRVSKESEVIEHDPDGGYVVNVGNLIAGGNGCATIEEFTNDHKVEAKDVSQLRAYYAAEAARFYDASTDSISLEEFTDAVQEIFGKDYEFKPEEIDFSSNCSKYKYNSSSKEFVKSKNTCKYSCGMYETSYKVVKVIEEYGKYTLDVKVLFASKGEEGSTYYSDFARENAVEGVITAGSYGNLDHSSGSTYRFIFESKGSNYYFVSSEPVTE